MVSKWVGSLIRLDSDQRFILKMGFLFVTVPVLFRMWWLYEPEYIEEFAPIEGKVDYDIIRKCLIIKFNESNVRIEMARKEYEDLYSYILICIADHRAMIEFFRTREPDDRAKAFVVPTKPKLLESGKQECTYLTLGIGRDTHAEREFLKKYPKCKMYGVEPSQDQLGKFKEIGTVYPIAAGLTTGRQTMRIRKGQRYVDEEVDTESLGDIIQNRINKRIITYATVDVMGKEFELLGGFMRGGPFANITICQLDVTFHDIRTLPEDFNPFEWFIRMFQIGPFIPMHVSEVWSDRDQDTGDELKHYKITFFNDKNPTCAKWYTFERRLPFYFDLPEQLSPEEIGASIN